MWGGGGGEIRVLCPEGTCRRATWGASSGKALLQGHEALSKANKPV